MNGLPWKTFVPYSPPAGAHGHEFSCIAEYTREMGIPSCLAPPPSRKGRGKVVFYDWTDIQSLEKSKAKTMGQMLMVLQDNFGLLQSDCKSKVLREIVRKI